MSRRTPHERNPILYGPERGADYLVCRDCLRCMVAPHGEFPGVLQRDLGWCEEHRCFVDPDERREPADVSDCYAG